MKKTILTGLTLVLCMSVYAQADVFSYLTEFETQGDPLSIAADSSGGLYYTVFTFSGANLTACYYIADPVNANALESHVLVDNGAETDVPAGRGFTSVAVDAQGNVYLALESGNAATASVRKLSPAPAFEPVDDFFGGIVAGIARYNGVEVLDDTTIALTTFNTVEFWDSRDATPLITVTGGEAFQRELAYNPNTHDIYIAKNGGNLANSANLLSGGSPDNLDGYTTITAGFIAQGGVATQYGSNGQLIAYDAESNLIYIPDYTADEPPSIAAYDPADLSAPAFKLDASESPNGAFTTPSDAVAVHEASGDTLLFVTDNPNDRIVVFTTGSTHVGEWSLY